MWNFSYSRFGRLVVFNVSLNPLYLLKTGGLMRDLIRFGIFVRVCKYFLVRLDSLLGVMCASYCFTSGGVCCPLVLLSVVVKMISGFGCCQPDLSLESAPSPFHLIILVAPDELAWIHAFFGGYKIMDILFHSKGGFRMWSFWAFCELQLLCTSRPASNPCLSPNQTYSSR